MIGGLQDEHAEARIPERVGAADGDVAHRSEEAVTARDLAERLGVSLRTLRRDIALLRERGHPIRADAGRGGGVRLERDRGATAVHLGVDEIASLWLGAMLARVGSAVPFGASARRAAEKLFATLSRERARELRALVRRVIVGPPATPSVAAGARAASPEVLATFEEAFRRRVAMSFAYEDRTGKTSARVVEPHGLLVQTPVWYVLTRAPGSEERRMFRMGRIRTPALEGRAFVPSPAVIDALAEELAATRPRGSSGPQRGIISRRGSS